MALSLALIILLGMLSDHFLARIKVPGLIGMLLTGIMLGPYVLDVLDPALLKVSSDLRMLALVVILLRAGLKIKRDTLNRVGKTAFLMSVVPSSLEGLAVMLAAPALFGLDLPEAAILGFTVAAVSPAVVVPSMLGFMQRKVGTGKGIPTMVLASSSLDNAYVIAVFSALLGIGVGQGGGGLAAKLFEIPVSIALGVGAGLALGLALDLFIRKYRPRHTKKALAVIGVAVLLTWLERVVRPVVPFSALLGVMAMGFVLLERSEATAHAISEKLGKIWVPAEILLFALVGAQVNISVAWDSGLAGAVLIILGLAARSAGTWLSVMRAGLDPGEKLFCAVSYLPKATVQAAIGAIPLSMGIKGGELILAVAVLSILITAPLGAIGIDIAGRRYLKAEGAASAGPLR